MKQQLFALVLASVTASATPVFSADITADNPAAIADLMRAMGYRAELTADNQGDPKINSATGGSNFRIYFYGCTANKDCRSIQFAAGFDLTAGTTLDVVNKWNAAKRYTKAYLDDEQDPLIEMDINLDFGGVSENNFRDSLDLWEGLLAGFKQHINFN
ncbi:MAG: YbjN domain-containing protein [Pseudorhodobacter sp.]|nr:YbjN domain-containing protein [Pseudorhodobacter sp.]